MIARAPALSPAYADRMSAIEPPADSSASGPAAPVRPSAPGGKGGVEPQGFDVPEFYGEAPATEFMTGIAAPLLAGAAIAITGVVVQQPSSLRWPGVTLLLLIAAASLLITAVQMGFLARRHVATPGEIAEWWPGLSDAKRVRRVRADLKDDAPLYAWWSDLSRWAYGLGIVALWAGLGCAVMPGHGDGQPVGRWFAAGVGWATAVLEIAWFVATRLRPGWFTPRRIARRHYYGRSGK
ncbi:hypothetical protein [Actinoallomurus rhizosphaericola]|uniref:hypothetical protein n=1 Tax=Actinoallomurus rhizosphaericola TaxID=2952536 RepID=UPI0020921E69|nr:hypothetical protein [Actinoallomurus rhizosphaericola]MCO5994808.1 hypothetical protein [Actinoallomurus rhizosphaericola]